MKRGSPVLRLEEMGGWCFRGSAESGSGLGKKLGRYLWGSALDGSEGDGGCLPGLRKGKLLLKKQQCSREQSGFLWSRRVTGTSQRRVYSLMTARAWKGRESRSWDQRSGCAGSPRMSHLEGLGFCDGRGEWGCEPGWNRSRNLVEKQGNYLNLQARAVILKLYGASECRDCWAHFQSFRFLRSEWTWEFTFLINSQVMLLLLLNQRPLFENHWSRESCCG